MRGAKCWARLLTFLTLLFALPTNAAPLGRPIWWKVSNGAGSTLWIMGVPDGLPTHFEWNEESLRHRIALADAAILPELQNPPTKITCPTLSPLKGWTGPPPPPPSYLLPDAIRTAPGGDAAECRPIAWRINMVAPARAISLSPFPSFDVYFDDPLSRRLPPALLARVDRDLPFMLGETVSAVHHARTMDLALWMDLWNWPHGDLRLGHPVSLKALELIRNRHIKLTITPQPKLWMPVYYSVYASQVVPPEALQQKCLAQVLDQTESGQMPTRRLAALQAWANGDLQNAMRRTGTVHYCLMGDERSSSAQDFLKNAAYRHYIRLDKAFDTPGQTVSLVELDPLLLADGGVLDHFRRLGFEITTSDGME